MKSPHEARTRKSPKALRALAALPLLATACVGSIAATAQSAAASGCSYSTRLITQDFRLESGTYVGYVELLYSSACRSVESHFHVDSTFRANHSGWNIGLALVNNINNPTWLDEKNWLNTSSTDFTTNAVSIDGHADYNFIPGMDWNYNGCKYELSTPWWNFSNGRPNGAAPWGYGPNDPYCTQQR